MQRAAQVHLQLICHLNCNSTASNSLANTRRISFISWILATHESGEVSAGLFLLYRLQTHWLASFNINSTFTSATPDLSHVHHHSKAVPASSIQTPSYTYQNSCSVSQARLTSDISSVSAKWHTFSCFEFVSLCIPTLTSRKAHR